MDAAFPVPEEVLLAYGLVDAHIEPLTGGRTNRTMRARAGRDVVLQQLLGSAHGDLLGVMENLVRVTSHLDWKGSLAGDPGRWYPQLVPTVHGKPFLMSADGDVWRAFAYRQGQIVRSAQPLRTLAGAGALYGRFTAATADLGGPPLIATTPGFHDLDLAFAGLLDDLDHSDDVHGNAIIPLVDGLIEFKERLDARAGADGLDQVAERVVHNDTKLSNVLFDRDHGRAIAVLDLDLVMMGPGWHDTGDLIRSVAWHAPDGSAPTLSPQLFDAVVGAYVEAAGDTLSQAEIATFAVAGPRLAFELGVRYLNDHLRHEPQLRVSGPDGHLRRGVANLNLAREMLGAYDALRQLVDGFANHGAGKAQGHDHDHGDSEGHSKGSS